MIAFQYECETRPDDELFNRTPRPEQLKFLRSCMSNAPETPRQFRNFCRAIIEAYGMQYALTEGTCEVLIDFLKKAPARCKKEALRAACPGETWTT